MDCSLVRTLVHRYVSTGRGRGGGGWGPTSPSAAPTLLRPGAGVPAGSRSSGRWRGAGEARRVRTSGLRRPGGASVHLLRPAAARSPASRGDGAARRHRPQLRAARGWGGRCGPPVPVAPARGFRDGSVTLRQKRQRLWFVFGAPLGDPEVKFGIFFSWK